MNITIIFRNGEKTHFDANTVTGYKSTDRTFIVLTNGGKDMRIYNMSIVNSVKLTAAKGKKVEDFVIKE